MKSLQLTILFFVLPFLVLASSKEIKSDFICKDIINVQENILGPSTIELVSILPDNHYGIYRLTNNGNSTITLDGFNTNDDHLQIQYPSSEVWRLDLTKQNDGWKRLPKAIGSFDSPTAKISIKPGNTTEFIALVGGKEDFNIDTKGYAYRLFLITSDQEIILSKPYCL